MLQDKYLNKLRELPEPIRQFGGLVTITVIVILSFAILNIFWGGGEELIEKMKKEEQRIADARKLSELISTLPPGILVSYEGTCLLYTSPSPRDLSTSRMPSSA